MSQNENIRIYVISHSEEDIKKIKENEIYIPLFVGRNGKDNLGFLSDDSFKGNISSKNKDYCELTGLYWMWKESDADIIGLCHYRRYFKGKDGKRLEKKAIIEDLSNHDIIVSKKSKLIKGTYWETFKGNYFSDALKITREIIKNDYPNYLKTFDEVLSQDSFFNYNMFIAKKEIVEEYCNWIFPILEEVENKIDIEKNPRVFGLISESIFNVWVEYKKLKIKERPLYYIGTKLNFRMKLIDNKLIRKLYLFLYHNFFNKRIGKYIEEKLTNYFF